MDVRKLKKMIKIPVILGLMAIGPLAFGSGLRLIDYVANEAGLTEMLSRVGVRGQTSKQVRQYVDRSFYSLSTTKNMTPKRLRYAVNRLKVSPEDAPIKARLLEKLNKADKEVTKEDVTSVVNDLIYLSNRHGSRSTSVMACAQCVSESLSSHNFKYTLESVKNKNSKKVLRFVVPKKQKDVFRFVKNNLRKKELNFGGYSANSLKLIAPEEEKAMALFLGIARQGNKTQKAYVEAVRNISTNTAGQVKLLDPENGHKLWKIPASQISDKKLRKFTALLNEVAKDAKGKTSKKDSFYKLLEKRAANDPSLQRRVNVLKKKGCFFK